MDYTEEQESKILAVRILIGDLPQSIFYPILSDDEIAILLETTNWNVYPAARKAAMSAAFILSMVPYRERTGDIESWNNASIQYGKYLQAFLDDNGAINLPPDLIPYAAGISKIDVCASNLNSDKNRSSLAQITPCNAWWTTVKGYPCEYSNLQNDLNRCGC